MGNFIAPIIPMLREGMPLVTLRVALGQDSKSPERPMRRCPRGSVGTIVFGKKLQFDFDPAHFLIEPIGKLVDKALLEARLRPVVEDKAQVGKPALLQE